MKTWAPGLLTIMMGKVRNRPKHSNTCRGSNLVHARWDSSRDCQLSSNFLGPNATARRSWPPAPPLTKLLCSTRNSAGCCCKAHLHAAITCKVPLLAQAAHLDKRCGPVRRQVEGDYVLGVLPKGSITNLYIMETHWQSPSAGGAGTAAVTCHLHLCCRPACTAAVTCHLHFPCRPLLYHMPPGLQPELGSGHCQFAQQSSWVCMPCMCAAAEQALRMARVLCLILGLADSLYMQMYRCWQSNCSPTAQEGSWRCARYGAQHAGMCWQSGHRSKTH